VILVLVVLLWCRTAQAVPAGVFDFNDGTVQGWTLQGAFDPEIYNVTFPCNFINGWNDYFNYPEVPGLDPVGNMRGSLQMYTQGGHGIDNPGGEWWLMQFHSPDLSTSESWQRASGYSVRIAECMGGGLTTLNANLFVKVHDLDLDRDRFFANGVAVPLAHNSWSYHSHNWWGSTNFPTNYVVSEVFVDIWGLMAYGSYLSGGVYLDEVIPIMPIYVDDDGGGPDEDGSWEHPFDSIQEGIDAAVNGKTVIVRDGTYAGEGNRDVDFLGLAITVHSENGPNTCIINCEGTTGENHRGFYFHSGEDANSVLEGFTIINGFAHDGGGICCDTNSSPSIRNCVISDSNANLGAGIYCNNSSPTITNCMISNGDANSGGGIYSNSSDPTITNCTFNGNQASNYGGAICCYSSNPVITNCTIQGNSAIDPIDSYGGGIYCNNSSATVKNCIFWDDTVGLSGAEIALVDTSNPSELTISYSDVDGGFAAAYVDTGCTLNWDGSNIDMDPCLMPDNYHLQSSSPCIDFGDPVGDYTDETDIDGYSRIFNARVDIGADEFSPPIHNVTQGTYHDTIQQAIDAAVNGDTITIPDGIYTGPGNRDVHFNGKAITVRSENGPANCVIDCDGTEGGDDHRGFCFNHNEESNSILDGVTITNGYGMTGGGIWCHYSNPTIINCIIRGNTANDDGGGIYCSYSSATISNCTLTGNTAWRGGGAIACIEGSQATINNCTTSFNISRWGGGIYCNNSSPSIRNCILSQDIASGNGAEIALKSRYYPSTLTVSYSNVAGGSDAAYVESGCSLNWDQGNIDIDPLLTPDGHLLRDSPCIDAGDPNLVVGPNTPADIDGDDRIINGRIDMGPDEFLDSDGDRLPDCWEDKYFGDPNIADHNADPDNDGLSNLHEYELYSSDPNTPPYYVDTTDGNDNYDGLASTPQGGGVGPKKTIQAGIDAADNGDTVIVTAGTYAGPGNRWLDFGSKLIVLRASNGPASTTIDCENVYTRAFNFHLGETPAAAVVGFTITNGLRNYGGAIVCLYSHPQIRNCVITDNTAFALGSGLYSYMSMPTFADCNIINNSPDGAWMQYGGAHIDGTVKIVSNNWVGNDIRLTGNGTLQIDPNSTLDLDNSTISCNLFGTGNVEVDFGSELIIEGDAIINLHLINTRVIVTRASFEGDVDISNSIITAEAGAPYGQFFIEDTVHITGNDIHADGDRYMDLDPSVFAGLIANNRIFVTITEGVGQDRGGLLELRGDPNLAEPSCEPNEFFCQLDNLPVFDTNSWMIERLELVEGAKVNLTNLFWGLTRYLIRHSTSFTTKVWMAIRIRLEMNRFWVFH
jgi:parallel beta-helix repeat protein/predicted outer membrane repeat protein